MFLCCYPYGITILRVLDDIIISSINSDSILRLHDSLQALFHMKDLGPFTYFLGVKVYKSNNGLFINQQKYTQDPIAPTRLQDSPLMVTPLELNVKY